MTKKQRNEKRARTALSALFCCESELIGRQLENDDDLLEAAQALVADLCHLFKREKVEKPVTTVVVAGVKKFREEE
jgi:hypothetical protein